MHDKPKAEIVDVLVRYATAIDSRDWELLRACFTDDARCDYGEIGTYEGADALVDFMRVAHASFGPSNHMLSNFVVDVDGDRATARSYVHAVLTAEGDPESWIDSVGTYADELVRDSDGWRIATRQFRLTRMTTWPLPGVGA